MTPLDLQPIITAVLAGGGINTVVMAWGVLQIIGLIRRLDVIETDLKWLREEIGDRIAITPMRRKTGGD